MERVRGVILRARPPEGLDLSPEVMRRVSEAFVDTLVALHRVDAAAAGLAELGKGQGYLRRQVEGWTQRYRKAQTDALPQIDEVAAWLAAHCPPEAGTALIHNDFKYDNLVLDPEAPWKIRAVLDWEMATLGDPLADLGTALSYWIDADDPDDMLTLNFGLTALPGNLTRARIAERYAAGSGRGLSAPVFHYALGLFKVAGIAQQLYFRFKQGFTKDERFALLLPAIETLARQAGRAISQGKVSDLES